MSKKLFLLTSFVLVVALACTNVSFGATIERTIANGNDDVEERPARANAIDITSSDLEFPYEDAGKGDPQVIGLRYIDIAIPKGATITNASVQFKVDETKDGTLAVNLIIDGELAANAAAFSAAAFSVTSRVRTTASVKWSVPNWTKEGDRGPDQATPNIAAVIQEIVNQDGWVSGNALVLTISDDAANPSAGLRCAEAFEGDAPGAAMLHIDYEEGAPPPPPPPPPPAPISVDIRITDGTDDAEQHLGNGSMDITSSDLELAYEDAGSPATDEQIIGLRFVSITVPKGVQITAAYVEFEVDKVDKQGSQAPVNLIIEGELTAAPFTSAAQDITNRTSVTTAKVKWSVPPWTAEDVKFQTADVSSIIQEIVNQDGWASGNALVLLIRDDKDTPSTGLREAEAFEGEATAAPLLHIEYTEAAVETPWTYTYTGDAAEYGAPNGEVGSTSLDGTWSHQNGSDSWEGTGPGVGMPGGAATLTEDTVTFLRIQDTGDPRDYGMPDPSNRKIYFTHETDVGLDGAKLEFRARVATTPPLDNLHPDGGAGIASWPAGGIGYHIRDDGKGMFGIAEPGVGIISFSLAKAGEPGFETMTTDVLVMNNLVGNTASGDVDTGVAAATAVNMLAVTDATQWNTFTINIAVGGAGTHIVSVSVNGEPAVSFEVTVGTGTESAITVPYIAMGSSGTGPTTAYDVDYFSVGK